MPSADKQRPIAVVGAGTMGSGIAQKIAQEGFPVVLLDTDDAALDRGRGLIRSTLEQAVGRKLMDQAQADAILGRITFTTDYAQAASAELAIEAVFEDLGVKRKVFATLAQVTAPDCILASNTSSLYVRDLAASTGRPAQVVGLHYFFHPAKNRLVEVVPAQQTSPETVTRAEALQDAFGKTAIRSADAPGFIVNRFFVPWLNEAVRLLGEGVADTSAIDAVARASFGVGLGPFALMNATGVPIAFHAATTLGRELGPFYQPDPRLEQQARSGQPWAVDPSVAAEGVDTAVASTIAQRLDGAVFFVAASLVSEGVGTLEDTDIGARVGLRWPRGPFQRMNDMGPAQAVRLAQETAARWSLPLPPLLAERLSTGAPFPLKQVKLEVDEGVATITINRPDALNALSPTVVEELGQRVDEALERPDVQGIVLRGAGKAFVAGADVKFFLDAMTKGEHDRIDAFARSAQGVLSRLENAPKTVVAVLDGLSLGGGSELALSAHYIVATERGSLGFPETGLGIYPGLGGTQRTPRRVGVPLAQWLVLTGDPVDARTALELGLVDRLVSPRELAETVRRLAKGPRPPRRETVPSPRSVPAKLQPLAQFFEKTPVEALLDGSPDTGGDPTVERALKKLRSKAPIATRLAARIIAEGAKLPLNEALELENRFARQAFASEDAKEGMEALLSRRRPLFQGK